MLRSCLFFCLAFQVLFVQDVRSQDMYEKLFTFFPTRIPGYVTDPAVVSSEDDGRKTYTNVSKMFYSADGERILEIKLKDFNLNPKNYEEEFEQVKKAEGSYSLSAGRSFTFQGFTAFEKRKEVTGSWILFLGDQVIMELVYTGKDDDFKTISFVSEQLNIKAMKEAFLVIRSKGRL